MFILGPGCSKNPRSSIRGRNPPVIIAISATARYIVVSLVLTAVKWRPNQLYPGASTWHPIRISWRRRTRTWSWSGLRGGSPWSWPRKVSSDPVWTFRLRTWAQVRVSSQFSESGSINNEIDKNYNSIVHFLPVLWIRIRIRSVLNRVPGSGFAIRIRISDPGGQKWPTKIEKSEWTSFFEVLDFLFWGLKASPALSQLGYPLWRPSSKFFFSCFLFLQFLVIKSPVRIGSGSGFSWNAVSGSTTLLSTNILNLNLSKALPLTHPNSVSVFSK